LKTSYRQIPAYVTKDGSEIRELIHPALHGGQNQSLAEATVPPGTRTLLHRHRMTEEIYHVTAGNGRMTLGNETFDVVTGDSVLIPPGTLHCIETLGNMPLRILCCCSPAYAHEDTELLEAKAIP
jgi:mannose-6-phosphate isomerase-like protein (cupin superfamily)